MTGFEMHQQKYPLFHQNKFIQDMSDKYKWTISNPDSKMPINIRAIMDGSEKMYGAKHYDERNLATLEELTNISPDIINCALYLNSQTDDYICLDIESTCPKKVQKELLKLPYVYGETSMSGKGIHLIFSLPDDWYTNDSYNKLRQKSVSREQHGWYELLCAHFVTFTRNMLPPSKNKSSLESFLEELNKTQKISRKRTPTEEYKETDIKGIPYGQDIADRLSTLRFPKTLKDFDNDDSKYEFYITAVMRARMMDMLKLALIQKTGHEYTHNELCTILYTALVQTLDHRDKHDTLRNGLPYLYFTAESCILKSDQ